MEKPKTIDIRSAGQHLLAKYNRQNREFEIVHKGEVTIIRVFPNGEIEIIHPEQAA